jgi:DNA-binding NarL/FixJ family response regulator
MTLCSILDSGNPADDKTGAYAVSPSTGEPAIDTGILAGERESECSIIMINKRALDGECLAQSLRAHGFGAAITTFVTVEELRRAKRQHRNLSAIVLGIGGLKISDSGVVREIAQLKSEFPQVPFLVVADNEDLEEILEALEKGACGYIPTTVGIDVAVRAIELALAGGVFVPASAILGRRHLIVASGRSERMMTDMFTDRQRAIVEAVRRGKPNKIIAYELNMCESTVKIHVRNIMKKLRATNRTEVAYKVDALFPHDNRMSA